LPALKRRKRGTRDSEWRKICAVYRVRSP